jgi:hypothetical protein
MTMSPDKVEVDRLRQCPSCGSLWLADDEQSEGRYMGIVTALLLALRAIRRADHKIPSTFRLFLEFADTSRSG